MSEGAREATPPWGKFGALLEWYWRERRDLPWRRTRDPYAILVSEIMLQQTRVETVIPYYHSFLERFPSLARLAEASLEEVYEAWAGLGYYRRARSLQQAAQAVLESGGFPLSEEGLRQLPGIGDYTAAALSSIAWGRPAVALDGNAVRVLCRIYGLETPATATTTRQKLKEWTLPEIPPQSAGDFSQAVMELGARLCLPRQPQCLACPMQCDCEAFRTGRFGLSTPRRRRQRVTLLALRIWHQDRVLLERREDDPFLAQQWVTPWFFAPAQQSLADYQRAFPGAEASYIGRVKHTVTFRDLDVDVWEWSTEQSACQPHQKFALWSPGQTRVPRLTSKVLTVEPTRTFP